MKNIRIELVSDVNSDYCYLEIFINKNQNPFLEISISNTKELIFKFYPNEEQLLLNTEELELILSKAKDFLPKELKNREDFLKFYGSSGLDT
jgi:hypothetical protein